MKYNHLPADADLIAHNQYSVTDKPEHYMQCPAVREETLLEKIGVSAAFVFCVTLVIFMG